MNETKRKEIGKYTIVDNEGIECVRFDTKRKYTQEELKAQREEFEKEAKQGKRICISDLMVNHGM